MISSLCVALCAFLPPNGEDVLPTPLSDATPGLVPAVGASVPVPAEDSGAVQTVQVTRGLEYPADDAFRLSCDVYTATAPTEGSDGDEPRPAIVFVVDADETPSTLLSDGARAVAGGGLAGVVAEVREAHAESDFGALLRFLSRAGRTIGVDATHVALWDGASGLDEASSAGTHVPVLWAGANGAQPLAEETGVEKLADGTPAAPAGVATEGTPARTAEANPEAPFSVDALDPVSEREVARRLVECGQIRRALPFLRRLADHGDADAALLLAVGVALVDAGEHAAGAAYLTRAFAIGIEDGAATRGRAAFALACAAAHASRHDDAFARLEEAATQGFGRRATWERHPDLAGLHADARWPAVLARLAR